MDNTENVTGINENKSHKWKNKKQFNKSKRSVIPHRKTLARQTVIV